MLSRQSCVVGIFVAAFFSLLSFSFYYLYNAPIVGISVSWDKSNGRYDVASSTPWSSLKPGDVIKRIGTLQVGFYHLLTDNIHIHGREELFQWLEVKKDLFQVFRHPSNGQESP
jgi:hypothetical protein